MKENARLKEQVLIDMLMSYTSRLMGMMTDGIFDGEDFTQCRNTILALQSEIRINQVNSSPVEERMKWRNVNDFKDSHIIN